MRRIKRSHLVIGFLFAATLACAQEGPLAFILPAGDSVVVVLGDTPRLMAGFRVYRQDPGQRQFVLLTPEAVRRVADPYQAADLMGSEFKWVAKQVGSLDPALVWRKLQADRDRALALCLVSHGLRKAMGRTFIDRGLSPGEVYRYRVEILDLYDRVIDSLEERILLGEPQAPEAPREVEVSAGDGEVLLSWSYSPYRGRKDDRTVGFKIYRREASGPLLDLTPTPVLRIEGWLSYVDTAVENGSTYTYFVEAVDLIGAVSARAASPAVTPLDRTPPLVPTGLTAVDTEEGVLVLWNLSPELDLASYNVLRSDSVDGQYLRVNPSPVPLDQPRFLDRGIVRGSPYYYRVTAVDRSGNESKPSGPTTIIPADTEPPPAISGLGFEVDEDRRQVALSWNSLEVPDLLGYFVYRTNASGKAIRITAEPIADSSSPTFLDTGYKDRGLAPGASFRYGVSAVDSSYNEGEAVFVEVRVPDLEAPKPPLSVSVRPTPDGWVRLRWQPGLEKDLAGNRVYRKEDRAFELVVELERRQTDWIDQGVIPGKAYIYYVTVIDESGNESEPSVEVEIVPTDLIAPLPPAAVEVRPERRGFSLSWEESPSTDVAGYLVYRAAYVGAPWQKLTRKPVPAGPFRDRHGSGGNVYGVSAIDTSGNEGDRSTANAVEEKQSP
jgi:fibronectin type 3 domain-containing protein